MNKASGPINRIKLGLGVALLVVSAGCIVPVGGGYDGGPDVVVAPGPDVLLFGGDYGRGRDYGGGRDVHAYSQRGAASRAVAHGGGGGHGGRR
jgi:hypothetical protein